MFLRLRLKNWRSIEDAEVVLRPFTVLVGRNSTGKSNLVQALQFLHEASRDAATAVARLGGISSIRRWSKSKPFQIRLEVTAASSLEEIDTDSVRHELVLKSELAGAWKFAREDIEVLRKGRSSLRLRRENEEVEIMEGPKHFSKPLAVPGTTSAMFLARQLFLPSSVIKSVRSIKPVPEQIREPQIPTDTPRLADNARNIASAIKAMSPQQIREIVRAMGRVVPGLEDIRVQPVGRYLTLVFVQEHSKDQRPEFAATEMSDGALRALGVITAAVQMDRGEVLIIEEPEVNLHPGAAHVLFEVLHRAAERGLVLVTTHSPELLAQAKDEEILVCTYEEGRTHIGTLSSAQRALVREGLFSAAELMRSDELRAEGSAPAVIREAG